MRALRIAAWLVALAVYAIIALGAFDVGGSRVGSRRRCLPSLPWRFSCRRRSGSLIAIHQPRNVIAWILLLGGAQPDARCGSARVGARRRTGRSSSDRSTWPLPLRLADRGRVRLPERAPAVPALALGRRRGACLLPRLHGARHPRHPSPFDGHDAVRSRTRSRTARSLDGSTAPGCKWIWILFWLGILASLVAGAVAMILRLRRSRGHRAAPDHVARAGRRC